MGSTLDDSSKELARQKHCNYIKGNMVQDLYMLIVIPPKYSVAEMVLYIKGKGAIAVARQFSVRKRDSNGEKFWAHGYANSNVGLETDQIFEYIGNQERLDRRRSR